MSSPNEIEVLLQTHYYLFKEVRGLSLIIWWDWCIDTLRPPISAIFMTIKSHWIRKLGWILVFPLVEGEIEEG